MPGDSARLGRLLESSRTEALGLGPGLDLGARELRDELESV